MACHERGMALVSILFVLALMTAMVVVLTEKVWQSSRSTARVAAQERAFWAASAGIAWARSRLADDYRSSAGWQGYLATTNGEAYPAAPVLTTNINGVPVELYLRDNPDGDGDPRRDSDLRLYLLARACGPLGDCSLVEARCGLAESGLPGSEPYGAGSGVNGAEAGLPELAAEPHSYRIDD